MTPSKGPKRPRFILSSCFVAISLKIQIVFNCCCGQGCQLSSNPGRNAPFDEECAMRSNLYSLALVNTEQFSLVVEKFNFPFNGVMCVVVDVLCECDIRFLSRIQ